MTALILLLAAAQAGLLLWAAVHLSNIVMRPEKTVPFFWALATLAVPLVITKYTADQDRHRALCSTGDCLLLAMSVAVVRVLTVSREEEQLALEHGENLRRAADAAMVERQIHRAEQVKVAAAALETHIASAEKKTADPTLPLRHLTPSPLSVVAPAPRLPTIPRK
jgi:hypothetical protein